MEFTERWGNSGQAGTESSAARDKLYMATELEDSTPLVPKKHY